MENIFLWINSTKWPSSAVDWSPLKSYLLRDRKQKRQRFKPWLPKGTSDTSLGVCPHLQKNINKLHCFPGPGCPENATLNPVAAPTPSSSVGTAKTHTEKNIKENTKE